MPLTVMLYLFTREVYRYCIGIGWQQKTVYRYFKTVNVFNYGELNNQNCCICTWLAYGCVRCVWLENMLNYSHPYLNTLEPYITNGRGGGHCSCFQLNRWLRNAPTMSLFSYRRRRRTVCVKLLRRQYNSTWCDLRVPAAAFCTYQMVYLRRYSTELGIKNWILVDYPGGVAQW